MTITDEITNWLDNSVDVEDYEKVVITTDITEEERLQRLEWAVLDAPRRRELIDNLKSAHNIPTIEDTIRVIGVWQEMRD